MPRDREAEAQSSRGAAGHRFGLAETIEYIGQELRTDASSGIGDGEPGFRFGVFQFHSNDSRCRCELHCIRQEIPHDLLQTMLVA